MLESTPLNAAAREVIDTSEWFSIATLGAEGPHLAGCWSRNIRALGYSDMEIVVPVWRMEQTGRNLSSDPRIELLFVSATIQREKGAGQGLGVTGKGTLLREGPRVDAVRSKLDWVNGALIVSVLS